MPVMLRRCLALPLLRLEWRLHGAHEFSALHDVAVLDAGADSCADEARTHARSLDRGE